MIQSSTDAIDLPLIHQGKVREIYAIDDEHLLMVTSDRISAFDVILPTEIPGKGIVLTQVSNFWFDRFHELIPNQLATLPLEQIIADATTRAMLAPRITIAKRLQSLPIEAIVRGYLIGSGWKDYQQTGAVCGIPLSSGLQLAEQLPQPLYTPSTKAAVGQHDQNISFEDTIKQVGKDIAEQVRDTSLQLYKQAAAYALQRGIIIADTKFEFGLDARGQLHLIDEVLTPDSSRFWPVEHYQPGISPPSYDKQFVRDYLNNLDWDKTAPGPELPDDIVQKTAAKYQEALEILTKNQTTPTQSSTEPL